MDSTDPSATKENTTHEETSAHEDFSVGTNQIVNPETGEVEDAVQQLSNKELIKQAEEFSEQLELEKAVALYDEGVKRFPNDTIILDNYTDLLLQLDEPKKAKELIERSIQLNPNREGRKYFNYAEMLEGHESLQMYKKGIEVLSEDIQRLKEASRTDEANLATKQLATAHASIAELFMTHLCDEANAESNCEEALKRGLEVERTNIDVLQSYGNLRMIRNKMDEARSFMLQVFKHIQELKEQQNVMTPGQEQMPSITFRMQTTRLLMELEEFKKTVKILDGIIQEEDESAEAWYLLAFSLVKLNKMKNASECIKNVQMLIEKQKITDNELVEGTKELKGLIAKGLQASEQKQDDADMAADDDSYETVSGSDDEAMQ